MAAPGLIAKKVGMTRIVDDQGSMTPVTLLQVDSQKVTKLLTPERDGYHGIQVGYYDKGKDKQLTKSDVGRLRKAGLDDNFSRFREYRVDEAVEGLEVGAAFAASDLEGVVSVDITGITKGRGFQGATKRWNAKTGRRTHGSRFHRRPGSLGQRTTPGRVWKNKKVPGHMGSKRRTIQNLKVLELDTERNLIAVKGSVPGHKEGFLVLRPSLKAKHSTPEGGDKGKK